MFSFTLLEMGEFNARPHYERPNSDSLGGTIFLSEMCDMKKDKILKWVIFLKSKVQNLGHVSGSYSLDMQDH